jgi:hypothetical protein
MVHAVRLKVLASGAQTVDKAQCLKYGRIYCRNRGRLAGVSALFLFRGTLFTLLFAERGSGAGDHLVHILACF